MSAKLKRQINIEFGLSAPPRFHLYGLEFTSWHYGLVMQLDELVIYEPTLPRGVLILACAWCEDLPVREKANILASLPYALYSKMFEDYRPFYADYDAIYTYINSNSASLTYLLEVSGAPSNFFVSATKDLIRTAQHAEHMRQLERVLGVRWTPDMLYPRPTTDGSVGRAGNEFWQPLAAILHANPSALLKGIKQSVRRTSPDDDDDEQDEVSSAQAQLKRAQQSGQPDSGKIQEGKKAEPKEIIVRREGQTFTSLRNAPKSLFLELFYGIDLNPRRG